MQKSTFKKKYPLIDRIAIWVCLFVSFVAITILILVAITMWQFEKNNSYFHNDFHQEEVEMKITQVKDQAVLLEDTHQIKTEEIISEVIETEKTEQFESEVVSLKVESLSNKIPTRETIHKDILVIENYQESVSEWCLSKDNTDPISIWKRTDSDGNLLIAFKNNQENSWIATFKYEGLECYYYSEWTLCDNFFEEVTIRDIIDYSFTAYHEVGGKNAENVQAQVCVLINRQKCSAFPDSIRNVVTAEAQYSCSRCVVNRFMKSDNFLEEEDLEKCFRQAVLVLAGELIQEVPEDVVFAAKGAQGTIWKIIDGTIYCFRY